MIEMLGRAGHDVYRLGMTLWLRCPVEPGMTGMTFVVEMPGRAGHDVYRSGMTGSVVLDVDVEFRVWELDVVLW